MKQPIHKMQNPNKILKVILSKQVIEAYNGNKLVFVFDCVTGDSNNPTGKGTFHILRKHKKYYSHKYNVQMDYAMFFTVDGKAIHQYHGWTPFSLIRIAKTNVSSWFGSHGCVRLEERDAKTIFEWTPLSTKILIL